jgi:predicted aspartyl protease
MRRLIPLLLFVFAAIARGAVVVPVEIANARIHIPVSVDGNEPAHFVLDTGAAVSPLDTGYAEKVGVRGTRKGTANGASGSVAITVAPKVPYRISTIDHRSERVPLIPFEGVSLRAGRPLNGILGADLLKRFVTEIDYANETVTFYAPREFKAPANAVSIPIHFDGNLPRIKARLTFPDGRTIEATLLVDTGAGAALVLSRLFHEKHRVPVEGGLEGSFGLGVGGASKERVTRITSLEFGAFKFDNPVTVFSYAQAGALEGHSIDGLIGGALLRRFTLTADYPNKRFLFVPNDRYGEPTEFDMSGALLTTRDATYTEIEIFNILPNSPASEAGLRIGDIVRAIDGVPAKPVDLHLIRKQMSKPEQTYTFTIVRDGAEQQIKLTTRRMV